MLRTILSTVVTHDGGCSVLDTPDAEAAWLEKTVNFISTELAGRSKAGPAYWEGGVARLEGSVGEAPTARMEEVYQLMVAALEKFESGASGGDPGSEKEGEKLLSIAGEKLKAMSAQVPRSGQVLPSSFATPSAKDVRFASAAIVKRRKTSYGKNGILLLTDGNLTFVTADPALRWEVARSDIAHLKKPWYGMGSYLTFSVKGAYYALAFGRGGPGPGFAGAGLGLAGDVLAISALAKGAGLGSRWFSLLNQRAAPRP
jgi:hypothetical protein